jgi:hypothetical protein
MILEINANISENEDRLKILNAFINENLESYEEYKKIKISSGASKVISFNSIPYIRGILITSENRVKVETNVDGAYVEVGRGKQIVAVGINIANLKITNLDKEIDTGIVGSYVAGDTADTVTCKNTEGEDKNYTYSILIGTEVLGPFNLDYKAFYFSSYGHSGIMFETGTIESGENNDETAALYAAEIQSKINSYSGFNAVTVEYDTENKNFIVKATNPGANNLEFVNYDYSTAELHIGMYDPVLKLGTDDYAGKKVEILTGDDAGDILEISEISHENIEFTAKASVAINPGDRYRIYDDEEDCEVDVIVLL